MITLQRYLLRSSLLVFPAGFLAGLIISYIIWKEPPLIHALFISLMGSLLSVVIILFFAYFIGYKRFIRPANRIIKGIERVTNKDLSSIVKTDDLGYLKPVGYHLNGLKNT